MAKIADLFIKIGADFDDFNKEFSSFQDKMKSVGNGMKKTGTKMTKGLTVPLAGLATGAILTAANFEQGMNKVAALSGATGDELKAMEDQAKDLGATTKFSASEAADGMSFLAMAGFETGEIMGAMPGMLDLAASSGLDLASAADIASNIMSGFGIEAKNAGSVADILAYAASNANTDVSQMGEAMKYVAPIASGMGVSIEDTAAAVGLLGDAGIQGGQAGTTLRSGLSKLAKPAGEAAELMEELGINAFDSNGKMKPLGDVIDNINDATEDMSEQQRGAALSTIFGEQAMSGWMALLERGGDELNEFSGELGDADGTAKDMADTMNSGMMGAFTKIRSALEGLAIEFGQILAPAVMKVAEVLQKAIGWFAGLNENIKIVMVIVGALVAAIGPLLVVIGFLITALASVSLPVVGIVAGVTALIAIFISAMATSEVFRETIFAVFEALQNIVMQAIEIVKAVFLAFWEFLQGLWAENGEMLIATAQTIFETVGNVISTILDIIVGIISAVLGFIMDLWNSHGETVFNIVQTVFTGIMTVITTIINGIADVINTVLEKIRGFWDSHGENIMKIIGVAMEVVSVIIGEALAYIQNVMEVVWPTIQNIIETVWGVIQDVVGAAIDVLGGIIGTFASLLTGDFAGAWEGLKDIVGGVMDAIVGIFKGGINLLISAINGFIRGANKISFDIPSWVPGLGGKNFGISIPLIPQLAKGGVAGGATFAEIGEGAHPEMVAPLNNATMKPFARLISKHMPEGGSNKEMTVKVDPLNNRPVYLVSPDGRVLAEYVSDDIKEIHERDERINKSFKGGR